VRGVAEPWAGHVFVAGPRRRFVTRGRGAEDLTAPRSCGAARAGGRRDARAGSALRPARGPGGDARGSRLLV